MGGMQPPERFPEWAKTYDNWCLWSRESDRPGKPLTKGGHGVSWSDPDCGYSFSEAYEAAEDNNHFDGIGLVIPEDAGHYGIDLDGCLREPYAEKPKPWVPKLDPFIGEAYIEYSKSGTGLHIFAKGDVPDWWTNSHFSDEEHEGVEAYDNKFFIFTGDELSISGGTPDDVDATPFLLKVYNEIRGRLPDTGDKTNGQQYDGDGELSKDDVTDALDALDPDMTHSEWVKVGFAVHDWDDGSTGRRVFERWSKRGSKWDNAAENTVDWIWSNARQGDGVTAGTLIHKATEAGWSPPWDTATDGGTATVDGQDTTSANQEYDLGGATWDDVQFLLESDENDSTTRACNMAADILTEEHNFVTIRETGSVYYYDDSRGFYVRKGTTYIEEIVNEKLSGQVNPHRTRTIREQVVARNYSSISEFQPPEGKVCVKNGILDLDTRELEPHSPEYYFTAQLGVEYDPNATAERWPEFLERSVANPDDTKKLEEFIGYCLESWHHKRSKNLFVVGPTQSGKGTFQHAVKSLFGAQPPTVVHLTPQQIADTQFDVAHLKDAMLNTVNDINASKIEDSGSLKRIFAGEGVKLEQKHKDASFGTPKAKHLFTANWLPRVVGQDEALWRRVLIVEFPNKVGDEERDEDLKVKLAGGLGEDGTEYDGELSGILNQVLDARDRLHDQGGFTNDRSREETRKKWDSWRDGHKRFLYTQFRITGDSEDTVEKETYHRAFKEFAGRKGYGLKTKNAVTTALQYVPQIETRDSVYAGLRWRETDAADPDSSSQAQLQDPQEERIRKVMQWVDEFSTPLEGADKDDLVAYADDQGYDTDEIESAIDTLLQKGEIHQPQGGKLQTT